MNTFGVGELVQVLEDIESVKRLQAGHGEWTDSMAPVGSFDLLTVQSNPNTRNNPKKIYFFSKLFDLTKTIITKAFTLHCI